MKVSERILGAWPVAVAAVIGALALLAFGGAGCDREPKEKTPRQAEMKMRREANFIVKRECTNLVGFQRLMECTVFDSGAPTNWWALTTVDRITDAGGVIRTNIVWEFHTVFSGGRSKLFVIEDTATPHYRRLLEIEGIHCFNPRITAADYTRISAKKK